MIGTLRKRIVIEQSTLTGNTIGGNTEAWSTLDTVYANLDPANAYQIWHSNKLGHRVTHRITVRYRTDVTSDMRIKFGSRYFYIKSYRYLGERLHLMEILAEEGAPS